MTPDEPLHQIPTHSADEAEGRALGLDLARVKWVVVALLIGVLPGFVFVELMGLFRASAIMFGPAVLVALFQFFLLQDKPPGWFFDWIETRLSGAHLSPLNSPWS